MDRPGAVLVVGGADRREAVVTTLEDRDVRAAATGPGAVDGHLGGATDCVVCLAGPAGSSLATLAAVRERAPSVPAVVVDPPTDVTGDRTTVVGDAAAAVAAAVAGPGPDREGRGAQHSADERLRRLLRASRRLLRTDDLATICEVAVEAAEEVLGLPAVGVHLAGDDAAVVAGDASPDPTHEDVERLVPVATSDGTRTLFGGDPPTYTPDDEMIWGVYESGESVSVDDIREHGRESPARSVLVLPLSDHGVLLSSSPAPGAFDEATVDLGQLLAATTVAALDTVEQRGARRRHERDLRAERDRLSAMFENIPIPAATLDQHDDAPVVRGVNPEFEAVFGYDADELVGGPPSDHLLPAGSDDQARPVSPGAADGAFTREVLRRTADGLREFLLTVVPVDHDAAHGRSYAFYIDITERKRRQQRLRVLSRVLRHDLRNQVTVIRGAAEAIADRASDGRVEQLAAGTVDAAAELAAIGRKTRVVERVVVGSDTGGARPTAQVVEEAVRPFREPPHEAQVSVAYRDDAEVPAAEAVRLTVHELVENAVVHNDAATPRVWVHARTTDDGLLEVDVADDGPGIPDAERAVLTGEREATQLEHASGLGLWTARWVVGALGGEFAIEDRAGGGTVVELRLLPAGERPD
jgi:PAS domain S-box-containing protein